MDAEEEEECCLCFCPDIHLYKLCGNCNYKACEGCINNWYNDHNTTNMTIDRNRLFCPSCRQLPTDDCLEQKSNRSGNNDLIIWRLSDEIREYLLNNPEDDSHDQQVVEDFYDEEIGEFVNYHTKPSFIICDLCGRIEILGDYTTSCSFNPKYANAFKVIYYMLRR